MTKDIDWQVCTGLLTRCYRNLNTGNMSLTQQINNSWILIGHTDNLVIKCPRFYVSERGRQRVLKNKRKNVHAYCEGILASSSLPTLPPLKEIYYCPYSQSYFSWKETGLQLITADLIVVIDNQVLCTSDVRQPQRSLF
jgi:hypothetical protein